MKNKLSDGTYLQSNLSTRPSATAHALLRTNVSLKSGTVIAIHYPDDKNSLSEKFIEYDVAVSEQVSGGGTTVTTYRNCKINNLFGDANNNLTYTLQADANIDQNATTGAKVLLLCIDGRSDGGQAVIVGGLSDENGPDYTSDDGQFYDFNFNGINYNIDKDGEWTITFNSPVDENGDKANAAASGTIIKIDKEGRVTISDNQSQSWDIDRVALTSTWTNGNDSVVIDKGNKKIVLTSSGELSTSSQKATSVNSEDAINVNAKSDVSVNGQSNINITASSNMTQKANGWNVQMSGDVNIKAGGNVNIQGSGQAQMQAGINLIGDGSVQAAGVGISMCFGIGNLGFPVLSNIITGSSTVLIGT